MELKNGETVPEDAKSIIEIIEDAKASINCNIKALEPLDIMKLKEYVKRQKEGVKYYKKTSFVPKDYINSVKEILIKKLEKDYKEALKEDIDENAYGIDEEIDETYPRWYKIVLDEIENWGADNNTSGIKEIWISKTEIDIFNQLLYWIIFVGDDRKLDFEDETKIDFVVSFKSTIEGKFNDIKNEVDYIVCSELFAQDFIEEDGVDAFHKILVINHLSEEFGKILIKT